MKLIICTLIVLSFSAHSKLKLTPVKKELGIVWGMEKLDAETLIFTERSGKLKILNLKTEKVTDIAGAPKVYARGQGGLLDIKKHPNFSQNKRIYMTYSRKNGEYRTTAVGYGILDGDKLKNFKEIFVGKGESDKRIHFGSRIAFQNENTLFFTIGDRGQRPNAQNLKNHFGKVLRIKDDGSVPKDNPFVKNKEAMPEIWSFGHRNPQGLYYDSATKTLYEMEHGPRGGDEINIVEKGKNYGWPKQSYGKEYTWFSDVGEKVVKGMEQPIKYFVPSIAPSGLLYYNHDRLAELKGTLVSGALSLTHMNSYHPKTKKETRFFEDKGERVRSLLGTEEGNLYLATDAGIIYEVIGK